MERCLIVFCLLILIIFVTVVGILANRQGQDITTYVTVNTSTENTSTVNISTVYTSEEICNTPKCKYLAGSILTSMDFTVDPCEDFYKFSCGSYKKYENIYASSINHFNSLYNYLIYVAKEELEKPNASDQPSFAKKVKKYYQSCLNHPTSVEEVLRDFLNVSKLSDWPLSETDNMLSTIEDATALTFIYESTNVLFKIIYDPEDNSFNIKNGEITLGKNGLLNVKEEYMNLMNYVFLKLDISLEDSNNYIKEIIEFETSLAKIQRTERDDDSKNLNISELQSECPQIKWENIFNFWNEYLDYPKYWNNNPLNIDSIEYIKEVCGLIEKTDKRTVYDLIIWNMFVPILARFDYVFRELLYNFIQYTNYKSDEDDEDLTLSMSSIEELRWKTCISDMDYVIRLALDYMMISSMRLESEIKEVRKYIKEVTDAMNEIFSEEKWIDDFSKTLLKRKIKNIDYEIEYRNASIILQSLNQFFKEVNINDNYMENRFLIRKQKVSHSYLNSTAPKQINLASILHSFEEFPYYRITENSEDIRIQIGNMFPPFYVHGVPQYYNSGGLFTLISHELSHALGRLNNIPENSTEETEFEKEYSNWPEEFLKEYNKRKNCLTEQYSKFPLDGKVKINGSSAIQENFADNNALILSFRAYDKYLSQRGDEPKLPGLNFTNRQMLFLRYSQIWCQRSDSENIDETDTYSPAKYRALLPLMNSPEFSKAFECPLNSYMNPKDKCILW